MVTIDGIEYEADDLTDEVKYMIAQVKDIDDKLANLRFQMDQLTVAKNAFSDAVVKAVKNETSTEV
jgi:hypothetical protein